MGGGRPRQREALGEAGDDGVFDGRHWRRGTQLERHRGHTLVRDSAGQDMGEEAEVSRYVEGKAVGGHPLRDLDADGHDLAVTDPDACIAGETARCDPEVGDDVDQATLEVAQVEADIRRRAEIGRASCRERV